MYGRDDGKSGRPADTIAVVERAFFVLRVVAAADGALGVREVARRSDLSPATALRLLRTLLAIGMVERRPDGRYVLGSGVEALTDNLPSTPTAEQLTPLLSRLVETFGEGATAAVDDGDETLFLAHVAPASAVQMADVTGDHWPAHTTASGLVLMGAWSQSRLGTYLGRDLSWNAPNTVTDPESLRRRVEQIRTSGFAWSIEELAADAAGLAVPVVDARGAIVAAVGLYGPTYRLHPDLDGMDELPGRLMETVTRLSTVVHGT